MSWTIIHLQGRYISFEERKQHPYLQGTQRYETACGYLYHDTLLNRGRVVAEIEKVTCKQCLDKNNGKQ